MNEELFKFNLQRFAEGDSGGGEEGAAGDNANSKAGLGSNEGGDGKGKTFTQAEIDAAIAEKLSAEKLRWEKEHAKKADADKKEQERLSKLSDDERQKAELEKSKIDLEQREKELKIKELKLEVVGDLAKRNLPVSFLDYLVAEDNEKTLERITNFEKEFKKAIDATVTERLKGKTPGAGSKEPVGSKKATNGFMDAIRKEQARRS